MVGTVISTCVVGLLTFYVAKLGWIKDIDKENPMEALLFGALISAVDPVATLSIMWQCRSSS
jgi:sodium/hydrogen exchanger 8